MAALCVALVGLADIHLSETRTPAEAVVTVKGIMASKEDFFKDDRVQTLLRQHNLRVEVTTRGSREVALEVINSAGDEYDFAFPSGQPAADLIKNHRRQNGMYQRTNELFSSPIVLASYREYADALALENIAIPQQQGSGPPLYYTLNMAEFIRRGELDQTWTGLDAGVKNGNRILAHTSGVCRSNSGATYLGLVAFVKNNGNPPQTEAEIDRLAQEIQPLIAATGMPEAGLFNSYVTPEGKSQGPIVVVYEHQYLNYQIDHLDRFEVLDTDRVLLYPEQEFQTDPEFISLKPGPADKLAQLLATDEALRERMMQLGYRVFDATDTVGSNQLFRYLEGQAIPAPRRTDATRAFLPNLDLLESLIRKAGRCSQ
ncbi:hypothetical protein [Actinophytocola sp.]|uniref:hypothetical protein n=1 Tax=Actinophytocola sp. TaxID=1872138 RepID=UPI002ED09CF7